MDLFNLLRLPGRRRRAVEQSADRVGIAAVKLVEELDRADGLKQAVQLLSERL